MVHVILTVAMSLPLSSNTGSIPKTELLERDVSLSYEVRIFCIFLGFEPSESFSGSNFLNLTVGSNILYLSVGSEKGFGI